MQVLANAIGLRGPAGNGPGRGLFEAEDAAGKGRLPHASRFDGPRCNEPIARCVEVKRQLDARGLGEPRREFGGIEDAVAVLIERVEGLRFSAELSLFQRSGLRPHPGRQEWLDAPFSYRGKEDEVGRPFARFLIRLRERQGTTAPGGRYAAVQKLRGGYKFIFVHVEYCQPFAGGL